MLRLLCVVLVLTHTVFAHAAEFTDPTANAARVFALLEERLAMMNQVAAWKWIHDAPVYDATREQRVLESSILQAESLGFGADEARRFFALQIEWARMLQERYIATWQARGFDQSIAVADLNDVIRPELDRIGRDLLRALYVSTMDVPTPARDSALALGAARLTEQFALGTEAGRALHTAIASLHVSMPPPFERIRAAGVLRVGTTGDYAPFSSNRDGHLKGLDIALAERLAQALGVRAMFVPTSWPTLMQDLLSGAFDVAMSGITITPSRERLAWFSIPYQAGGKTAIVRCEDVARFDSFEKIDRPSVRIVVNPGGTNEQFVRDRVHHAHVQLHPDNRTIFDEILVRRADAMITDDIEVQFQTQRHPQLCAVFSKPLTQASKAVMLPRDARLRNEVNAWLTNELARGEVKRQFEQALAAQQ